MREIITISKSPEFLKQKRVAIYARISTQNDPQFPSLELQVHYFQQLVRRHLDWTLADTYADQHPGRSIKERPEFPRMIDDCFAGKVDMILTKSISRFGRNALETIDLLRKLRNIDVYFDLQELHSIDEKIH